jgi:hypothetical protein
MWDGIRAVIAVAPQYARCACTCVGLLLDATFLATAGRLDWPVAAVATAGAAGLWPSRSRELATFMSSARLNSWRMASLCHLSLMGRGWSVPLTLLRAVLTFRDQQMGDG